MSFSEKQVNQTSLSMVQMAYHRYVSNAGWLAQETREVVEIKASVWKYLLYCEEGLLFLGFNQRLRYWLGVLLLHHRFNSSRKDIFLVVFFILVEYDLLGGCIKSSLGRRRRSFPVTGYL